MYVFQILSRTLEEKSENATIASFRKEEQDCIASRVLPTGLRTTKMSGFVCMETNIEARKSRSTWWWKQVCYGGSNVSFVFVPKLI